MIADCGVRCFFFHNSNLNYCTFLNFAFQCLYAICIQFPQRAIFLILLALFKKLHKTMYFFTKTSMQSFRKWSRISVKLCEQEILRTKTSASGLGARNFSYQIALVQRFYRLQAQQQWRLARQFIVLNSLNCFFSLIATQFQFGNLLRDLG